MKLVCAALQRAVELEHSTIPLYLYALYSLVPHENEEIAEILNSVVVEEMLHMILAANVLNALGGSPAISKPDFIPSYPGQLPGGVEQHLTLHLRPFSLDQLEAFIEIEEPRDPIDHQSPMSPGEVEMCTIGEFYTMIRGAMTRLPSAAFITSPRSQIGPEFMFGSVVVTDLQSALEALDIIIEQGEGTATSPEEIDGFGGVNDFAHYYRFLQILKGTRLARSSVGESLADEFAYVGDAIAFNPSGVYPVPVDPKADDYPVGSREREAIDSFNFIYTTLLRTLHRLVNGHADKVTFDVALELMAQLRNLAKSMMAGVQCAGVPIGPSFEYQPVRPAAHN